MGSTNNDRMVLMMADQVFMRRRRMMIMMMRMMMFDVKVMRKVSLTPISLVVAILVQEPWPTLKVKSRVPTLR